MSAGPKPKENLTSIESGSNMSRELNRTHTGWWQTRLSKRSFRPRAAKSPLNRLRLHRFSLELESRTKHVKQSLRDFPVSINFQRFNACWRINRPNYGAKIERQITPDVGQGAPKDGLRSTGQSNFE